MLKRKFQLAVVADFLPGVLEKLPQVVVDKRGAAQNAYDPVQMQVVLDDGDEAVRDNGNTDLFSYGILGVTPKPFAAQMLLDSFVFMPPRTDFGSAAKMQISKPGQGVCVLSICA